MSVLPAESAAPRGRPERVVLARLGRALRDAARRTRARNDEEAIHDLRVGARRLASALSLWRDRLDPAPRRRALRRLRRLRRALGPARELEVHVADLEQRVADQPFVLSLLLRETLDDLGSRRERARRKAAAWTSGRRVRRIVREVRRAAAALLPGETPDSAASVTRIARIAGQADTALGAARAGGDDETLHAARVAVKKWRYALEAAAEAAGESPGELVARLRAAQKALGDVQDRVTLSARIERRAARLRKHGLEVQAAGFGPLLAEIAAERRRAIEKFQRADAALAATA